MTVWLPVIMVFLAIVMVVGPIMMLLPSRGQQKVASIRAQATELGFSISTAYVKGNDGKLIHTTSYLLPFKDSEHRPKPSEEWELKRFSYHHGVHFLGDWDWVEGSTAPEKIWPTLKECVANLPSGLSFIHCSRAGIGVHWDERCEGVPEKDVLMLIKQSLESLSKG